MVNLNADHRWIYQHVFESGEPTLVLALDSLEILAANPALAKLIDRPLESLVGKSVDFLSGSIDGGQTDWNRISSAKVMRRDGVAIEAEVVVLFMERVPQQVVCLRLLGNANGGGVASSPLVSKHANLYRSHRELQVAYNRLEFLNDQLNHRNSELRVIYRRLSYATKMAAIGELVAGTTHGINNPLAAAVSANREMVSFLDDSAEDDSAEDVPDKVQLRDRLMGLCTRTDRALRRIEDIVTDLRRISKAGARRGEVQSVSLADEIDLALEFVRPRLGGVDLKVEIPSGICIRVSPDEFEQVIINLVGNAISALNGEGHIRLAGKRNGAEVTVTVEDDGPGISEEIIERVFEPFFSTKLPEDGTGIGLSLAREIIEGYAGSLRAEALKDCGTRFVIKLPIEVDGG